MIQVSANGPTSDEDGGGALSVDEDMDEVAGGVEVSVTVTLDVAVTVDVGTEVGEPPQPASTAISEPPSSAVSDTSALFRDNVNSSPTE